MAETPEATIVDTEGPQFLEEGPTLPALLTEDFVKQFEKGVEVYKRWVSVCYRLTRESHWLRRDTKYSLQGPGAEALMNPLGISFERPTFRREDMTDERGGFYAYWCEGYVESRTLSRRGWYIGYSDSRDQFFIARPGWNPKSGEGDVKKSAMMNWIVNAVTRIAGIRDPDPESLKAAGLKPEQIPVADYSGRKTPEKEAEVVSEAQLKRLWAIARGNGVDDQMLTVHLLEKYGLQSTKEITRKHYDAICAWAQRGGKDNGGTQGAAGQQPLPGDRK
jgi:hypothetical protein